MLTFNNPPICSVLIPSLGRFDKLKRAIQSIFDTVNGRGTIEVIVRLHLSDTESVARAHELYHMEPLLLKIIWGNDKEPGQGNEVLWNHLRLHALGVWHQYFSDDMIMTGKGWDTMLWHIPTEGIIPQPEIHQLGASTYMDDVGGPIPFVPKDAFSSYGYTNLPTVPDVAVNDILIKKHGWKPHFLKGIGVHHQREEDATTAIANAT